MSLLINNITKSSLSLSFQYIDTEEVFGFVKTANYTINVSDISFEEGTGPLLEGREAIKAAYARPNIVARIGGEMFLNGNIKSITFSESDLVGSEEVSISIEEAERIDDYSSHSFANNIPSPHLVTQFEETYNFSRSGATFSSSRNVSVTYSQDPNNQFLANASAFLNQSYFGSRPNYGFRTDGISEDLRSDSGYVGVLSETVDLIGLTVSLKEDLDSSYVDAAKNVSINETETLSLTKEGYLEKGISIELTALEKEESSVLAEAMKLIIAEKIAAQPSEYGNPKSIQKGFAKGSKKATISLTFSTNPKDREESIIYSVSKQKSEAFSEYSLKASFKTTGKDKQARMGNTIALWSSWSLGGAKILALFPEATAIYEKSRNIGFNNTQSTISDDSVFSTDDSYNSSSLPSGILKYEETYSKQNQTERVEAVFDLVSKEHKIVKNALETVGRASATASVTTVQGSGIDVGKAYLMGKTTALKALIDEAEAVITSDEFTIDLGAGTASRVISYTYS
tara:strand:- start:904 stop:2442 length:1539 start_codon:yes stop_codon:yes gene_type:complete